MNALQLTTFDQSTTDRISELLKAQHVRLAQLDMSTRSLTAKNYDSAIRQLGVFLSGNGYALPTKTALEHWREAMLQAGASVSTVNARLAASRKLLRGVAGDVTDLTVKTVLRDWAEVADAKKTRLAAADKIEADYGRRFTLEAVQSLIQSIDTGNLKGLRDRALIAVMVGCGLRVSEVANLTMADTFGIQNEDGQRGIRVTNGKHHKSRVVVLSGWNSWVLRAVKAYTDAIGLSLLEHADGRVFRGVRIVARGENRQGTAYVSAGDSITSRNIEGAVSAYTADYDGQPVAITCHDLRRSYAKICKSAGMSWEALRDNMGHSSVSITEAYVGRDVDWSERVPNWTITL